MLLTQDQEMIRGAMRDFVQEQIAPHAAQWDREHTFPRDVHRGLAQLGHTARHHATAFDTLCLKTDGATDHKVWPTTSILDLRGPTCLPNLHPRSQRQLRRTISATR